MNITHGPAGAVSATERGKGQPKLQGEDGSSTGPAQSTSLLSEVLTASVDNQTPTTEVEPTTTTLTTTRQCQPPITASEPLKHTTQEPTPSTLPKSKETITSTAHLPTITPSTPNYTARTESSSEYPALQCHCKHLLVMLLDIHLKKKLARKQYFQSLACFLSTFCNMGQDFYMLFRNSYISQRI